MLHALLDLAWTPRQKYCQTGMQVVHFVCMLNELSAFGRGIFQNATNPYLLAEHCTQMRNVRVLCVLDAFV